MKTLYTPEHQNITSLVDYHQLGRLVSESAFERKDPGSNPAADMVDAARNTAWDLENLQLRHRHTVVSELSSKPLSRSPTRKHNFITHTKRFRRSTRFYSRSTSVLDFYQ
ncbi:hypothetical protein FHG87_017623 [Trinorchestia longiramus]|nr:hypothetical protein FHG87_017623 [Trinorchestia longiramus]